MNGTIGMMPKMAHAIFWPVARLLRVARSIHISTTASGWMKQTSISNSFFTIRNLPRRWAHDADQDAIRRCEPGGRAGSETLREPAAGHGRAARQGAGVPAGRQHQVRAVSPAFPSAA